MFPSQGDLLIEGKYMHYTMTNTEQQTNASDEKYIEVSVTRSGDTYNGRTNVMAPHSKGSQVFMVTMDSFTKILLLLVCLVYGDSLSILGLLESLGTRVYSFRRCS